MNNTPEFPVSISDKAFGNLDLIEDNGLELLSECGFSSIHLSYKWHSVENFSDRELAILQEKLANSRMRVLDVHGCHPTGFNIALENGAERDLAFKMFRHRLELTHAVKGDAMVYHVPEMPLTAAVTERFVDGLQQMEELARDLGIVVALENHYIAENDRRVLAQCLEKFDADYIGFTLDPGHASISGNTPWLLQNCMERLTVLHLNDNDGKSDFHWLPFHPAGTVNWPAITQAIARSPYSKPLQLEVQWRSENHASHQDFLLEAATAAQRLHSDVANLRV